MSDDYKPLRPSGTDNHSVYRNSVMMANAYRRVDEMRARARLRRILNDPALTARRPLYIIAALLMVAALAFQYSLLLMVGLLALFVAAIPEIWYAIGVRGLVFARAPEVSRSAFASVVEAPLTLENRSLLPLPFVELVDTFPDDLSVLGMSLDISPLSGRAELQQTTGLWAFQRVRRRYYVRASQRGAFIFGPTTLKVTDPFGVITREETRETERTLIIHPLIAPLDQFGLSPKSPFGDRASHFRLLEDPLRVSGVRQYLAGDDPRGIHWKATARLGSPQSKTLDPSTLRTLMIALDVRTFKMIQMGYDPALSELAISAAASVARWGFEHGYAVGLISNGGLVSVTGDDQSAFGLAREVVPGATPRLRLEPSPRAEWQTQILDGLARLLPYNGGSLAALLLSERRTLPPGASLVYIGLDDLVDVPTLIALRDIREKGRDVTLLLTSRTDADGAEGVEEVGRPHILNASGLDTRYVGGRERWRALEREALGELGGRKASAPVTADHLRVERALIAELRRERKRSIPAALVDARENQTHATSPSSGAAAEIATPAATR
jgi:uncharacterized protein (DUF58 family)